ncbi:MAG: alpha/beta fold hydrolase, partial [Lachnospiraceae bacterium]|nr:alpha/beta fold hydrolase [Lachnospiraceae bacterium]
CIKEIPSDPKGLVIAVHGFSSSRECATFKMLMRRMPAAGYGVVGFDLPGHGTSKSYSETLRIDACLDSIEAAEQYAAEQYPGLPLYYFASSFGAYLVGIYTSTREHNGRKAFLRSAAVNMPSLFITDDPSPEQKKIMDEMSAQGYADISLDDDHRPVRITPDLIRDFESADLFRIFDPEKFGKNEFRMAHGELDALIDPCQALAFAEKFGIPVTVFKGEGHSLGTDPATPDILADMAIEFFDHQP